MIIQAALDLLNPRRPPASVSHGAGDEGTRASVIEGRVPLPHPRALIVVKASEPESTDLGLFSEMPG